MKDEIKEILARLSRYVITPDVRHDFDDLLNYIANLQEENKVLLEKYSTIQILYNSSKLKNDKAIEYILNNKLYCFKYDDEELFEITTDKKAKDELLNILQGGDK